MDARPAAPRPEVPSESAGSQHYAAPQNSPPHSPQPIIIQQGNSGGLLFRLFALLGWMAFFFCALFVIAQWVALADYFDTEGGITEKHHSGATFGSDKVAIISIEGMILDGEGFVKHQIDRIRKDTSVKAIVIRVDSPGGTVTGSDYMFHHLTKLREEKGIPMVVSMGSMAASGGYYVAMAVGDQERSIFAEPTSTTGSIGVIIPHYDLSGLMERFDVKDDSIASHPRKQMLAMTRPITDDHRVLLQSYVDESFSRFKEIVKLGRPKFRDDDETLTKLATGEIFTANKAKEHGLIDEIGFLEEAIDRAIELANLNKDETSVIQFERPVSLFDVAGVATAKQNQMDLTTWLELSAPRGYYLATSLPPLITSYSLLLDQR